MQGTSKVTEVVPVPSADGEKKFKDKNEPMLIEEISHILNPQQEQKLDQQWLRASAPNTHLTVFSATLQLLRKTTRAL